MERQNIFRKGFALVIFVFFIFLSTVQSTETVINKSKMFYYPENSTICGFVTDFETGEPIFKADIEFFVEDYQGNDYDYWVFSDKNGYYIVENVSAGLCVEYGAYKTGYHFYWGMGQFDIPENETVWVNMSMYPRQPETSKVCGYVYDNYTGKPIFNVSMALHWFDIHGKLTYNGTQTDENGYYSMNFGAGSCDICTIIDEYIDQIIFLGYVFDNETYWANFSLDPEIRIKINKPEEGVYFKNKKIFPFFVPLIIGPIDIEFNVTLVEGYPIDHVEILIDGVSKQNYTSEPYVYQWYEMTPFRFRHTIKVIAHREWYGNRIRELEVWKFF